MMKNYTDKQYVLIRRLQKFDPNLIIHWDEVRGVASSIRGRLFNFAEKEDEKAKTSKPEIVFASFLQRYVALIGPSSLTVDDLRLLRTKKDELGMVHLFYQQSLKWPNQISTKSDAIDVYGAKIAAHIDSKGVLIEVQSSLWRDIEVDFDVRLDMKGLTKIVLEKLKNVPGSAKILDTFEKREEYFPFTGKPRLVVYPWKGAFPLAWSVYGYSVVNYDEYGKQTEMLRIAYGHLIVDAKTGEQILFSPTFKTAETPDIGSGLAVTPLTGTNTTRALNVVRVGTTSTYRLKDTTHNRDIVTFDVACDALLESNLEIGTAIANGTLPVSEDTDGDRNWNRLPTNTTAAQRTLGQQPEVDAHYFAARQYEWYNALASGRDGWDDGNYPNPPVPPQTINVLAHCRFPSSTCQENNGYQWNRQVGGLWRYWLAFMDCDNTNYTYLAGSHFLFAHEYQHAITEFSFDDGAGNPGLTYATGTWFGAVHEGLSDTFAALSSEQWRPGRDISPNNTIFRNIVYPRDSTAYSSNRFDHFDDRNNSMSNYSRGTILAHSAYLIGNGGVHQRVGRTPELIPVYSLGRETLSGMSFLKAARIWYRALSFYFSTHGNLTGIPANDENTFRTLRNGCVSAATDLYGSGSSEHLNTVLAFYAVGLHPMAEQYGPDVTFLRWGISWDLSRNYVGLTSPDYASLDLFINNGGVSEWNALINVIDPSTGQPTQFENTIYCRVRNIGDQAANDVKVKFQYAKVSTAPTTWLDVLDKDGNLQTLDIGTLPAGQSNFADSDQNTPPSSASVKWYIPPLASGEIVHHFCIRAVVTSSNEVNPHNNDVQSNILYTEYSPTTPAGVNFWVGNPTKKEIPIELKVDAILPKGWVAQIIDDLKSVWLKPGEERLISLSIKAGRGADKCLDKPFDGDLYGEIYGHVCGSFIGSLTETSLDGEKLRGHFSGTIPYVGVLVGEFDGKINLKTGAIKGRGTVSDPCRRGFERICVGVDAYLRPWRRVNISQWIGKEQLGGITVQIQIPWERGPFGVRLYSTESKVLITKE